MPEGPGGWARSLRVGLGFLTTLPVVMVDEWREDDLRLAVRSYPVVGAVIGVLVAGLGAGLSLVVPPAVAAALVVATWAGLTGALHLDGLTDVADAALAPRTVAERWTIVRDPRVGSFGLVATVTTLLIKVTATTVLLAAGRIGWLTLAAVPVVARTAVVWAMARHPVHDASLLGRSAALPWRETVAPSVVGLVLVTALVPVAGTATPTVVALATAVVVTATVASFLARRLDGLGGDAYGAIVELDEALVLAAATAAL